MRAKSSTTSHHSAARSHSPALVHAMIRLQYASPSVCTFANAPGRSGRHSLLQQLHTLLPAPCADLCPSQQAERESLQVRCARLPRDRQRPVVRARRIPPRSPRAAPAPPQPSHACAAPGAFKRALCARQPAARSRGASRDRAMVRDPDREARGLVAPPAARVILKGRARARRSRPPRSPAPSDRPPCG